MTSKKLQVLSKQQLADMARKKGIAGWHGMRKDEFVEALLAFFAPKQHAIAPFRATSRSKLT